MKAPNKWIVAFGLVYAALNLYVLFHLYFGTSRFLTTTVVYSWGAGLLFWLYTKCPRGRHWFFLQPVIRQQYGKERLYWPMDQHFLPQGYAILAKLVADSCTSISPRK
jgi:hypothetical protein